MSGYIVGTPPFYLSAHSAHAMVSDMQPTVLHPQTLLHVNLFLDEMLYTALAGAQSLNPAEIRTSGISAVFSADKPGESTASKNLGRTVAGEAELELRPWLEQYGSLRSVFGKDGNGMKRGGGFALQEAFEVMRVKCEEFSTVASHDSPRRSMEVQPIAAWEAVGGDSSDIKLDACGLYMTAIIENMAEQILTALGRVVNRDSDNTSASLEDLLTALAETDSLWGVFKRMQTRISLEESIKSRQKRSHNPRTDRLAGRGSPGTTTPYAGSQSSLLPSSSSGAVHGRETPSNQKSSLPPSSFDARPSHDIPRGIAGGAGSIRKSPSMPSAKYHQGIGSREHQRTPSVLSANTRNMLGAYNDQTDAGSQTGRSKRDEEDDFDALMASGETMKVSLTPSRLKNFETARKSQPSSPSRAVLAKDRSFAVSPPRGDDLPPLLPRGGGPSKDTPPRPPRSSSMRSRSGSNSASSINNAKLQARSGSIIAEQDTEVEELADELDSPFRSKKQANKESLSELLASTGPIPDSAFENGDGVVKRTVPAVILGTAPPKFDDDEPVSAQAHHTTSSDASKMSVNRPGRPVAPIAGDAARKRTPAREMADFFNESPAPLPAPAAVMHTRQAKSLSVEPNQSSTRKTPAQDMADFFNTTAPPPSNNAQPTRFGAPVENLAPAPAKKGFMGFMSKIGGGAKTKEKKEISDPKTEIPTAGGPGWVGVKGYRAENASQRGERGISGGGNMASSPPPAVEKPLTPIGGGAKAIAEAYREQQRRESEGSLPVLAKTESSSNTAAQQQRAAPAAATAAPFALAPSIPASSSARTSTPPMTTRASQDSLSATSQARAIAGSPPLPGGGLTRKTSIRKPVPYADTPDVPPSPSLVTPQAAIYSGQGPAIPPMSPSRRKPSTVDEADGLVPDQPYPHAVEQEDKVQTLREEKSSEHMSFATAREEAGEEASTPRTAQGATMGDHAVPAGSGVTPKVVQGVLVGGVAGGLVGKAIDTVPEAADARSGTDIEGGRKEGGEMDTVPEATAVRDETKSAKLDESAPSDSSVAAPTSSLTAQAPTIPLQDLLPLRHLLDQATSVRECQLLLSAILSQWGVPPSSPGEAPADPESRITAWLLAGREGPTGDFKAQHVGRQATEASTETTAVDVQAEKQGDADGKAEGVTISGIVEEVKQAVTAGLARVI